MAYSSTTGAPILGLIAGGCWARPWLPSGIKDVSVTSELRKSLTLVTVVLIGTLSIPEHNGRFLHNHYSDPEPDCGRLLGSTPATQPYQGRLCGIKAEEVPDPGESCPHGSPGTPRAQCQIHRWPLSLLWI